MKVRLNSIDKIYAIPKITQEVESDVFFKVNRYVIDAKSILGILSLGNVDAEVDFVEKNSGDIEYVINKLRELDIIVEDEANESN